MALLSFMFSGIFRALRRSRSSRDDPTHHGIRGAGKLFESDDIGRIEAGLKRRLGESVTIDVKVVDVVPAEASGKFRYVISRVAV
jgi:hypothetical protein